MNSPDIVDAGSWFTEARIARMGRITVALRTRGGWPAADARRRGWEACGGPIGEIEALLRILETAGIISQTVDRLILTKTGDAVALRVRRGDRTALSLVLLRGGLLHRQARFLLEVSTVDENRILRCPFTIARAKAPQLVGMLIAWPNVMTRPVLTVPAELVTELSAAWALLPPFQVPSDARERQQVGHRAEYYSWIHEREKGAEQVFWVARERDDLGYDIEDRRVDPPRCIEVKGRRDRTVTFVLSDNEWQRAVAHRERYEIHFWGDIDLNRTPSEEYGILRADGWPHIVVDPAGTLRDTSQWQLAPIGWRVSAVIDTANTYPEPR